MKFKILLVVLTCFFLNEKTLAKSFNKPYCIQENSGTQDINNALKEFSVTLTNTCGYKVYYLLCGNNDKGLALAESSVLWESGSDKGKTSYSQKWFNPLTIDTYTTYYRRDNFWSSQEKKSLCDTQQAPPNKGDNKPNAAQEPKVKPKENQNKANDPWAQSQDHSQSLSKEFSQTPKIKDPWAINANSNEINSKLVNKKGVNDSLSTATKHTNKPVDIFAQSEINRQVKVKQKAELVSQDNTKLLLKAEDSETYKVVTVSGSRLYSDDFNSYQIKGKELYLTGKLIDTTVRKCKEIKETYEVVILSMNDFSIARKETKEISSADICLRFSRG